MRKVISILLIFLATVVVINGQSVDTEKNYGLLIGKFNVYHHGISGSVYAVNATTLLVKNFYYDGQGKDAYFWGGSGGTGPGPNGFIIHDQWGRTNVLSKSSNADFTLTLPDKKTISELKWISVYDLSRLENFGDIYIPDGFEPPGIVQLPPFISKTEDCSSDNIELIDMKTISIERLSVTAYGDQELYFTVGKGPVPTLRSGAGWRIPDENGYLSPLRSYNSETVRLTLPGEFTFGDDSVHWLAVYDKLNDKSLCYVIIPSTGDGNNNIPPSLRSTVKYDYSLPNCEPLHSDIHLAWDVVGQTITFEIVAVADEDDWVGFGLSGSPNKTEMIGSDIAIGHLNIRTGQGVVQDYNVDAKAPCTSILEKPRGVCLDSELKHSDSIQVLEGRRVGPLTVIKYRRQIKKSDEIDKDYDVDNPVGIIWAMGKIMKNGQPGFHRLYPKDHLKKIQFLKKPKPNSDQNGDSNSEEEVENHQCLPFLIKDPEQDGVKPWAPVTIVDGKLRSFSARLGPSGGLKGYEGITGTANPGYAWYIQGYLSPTLYMQRGLTYSFKVEGGNNPHNVETYHPFLITTKPFNGISEIRPNEILAGLETTRRGQNRPTAAGRLCLWTHNGKYNNDRRLDSSYPTFEKFRNSLKLRCENGSEPSILEVMPNSSWPDVVYYESYSQPAMGWKIHVVDQIGGADFASGANSFSFSAVLCTILLIAHLGISWICV